MYYEIILTIKNKSESLLLRNHKKYKDLLDFSFSFGCWLHLLILPLCTAHLYIDTHTKKKDSNRKNASVNVFLHLKTTTRIFFKITSASSHFGSVRLLGL